MPASGEVKRGTKQFMRQGHTTVDAYGSNYTKSATGKAGETPREIKP